MGLGIPIESTVVFEDDLDSLATEGTSLQLLDTSLNIEENVDYKIAYNLTEQRSLEMKLEKSKALPSISAFVNYGTAAFRDDFSFFDSSEPWFQSSLLGV